MFFPLRRPPLSVLIVLSVLPILFVLSLSAAAPARAEDGALTLEKPVPQGDRLFRSSLWGVMESRAGSLSPAWQRRYQELRSIAEDTDIIGRQLPPQLDELKRKFSQAQRTVVFLLLDLAPATMEAMDNYYLMCRLEEWGWYLAEPVRQVAVAEQALDTYDRVLREMGQVLARHRAEGDADPVLSEVIPELRSIYALLEGRITHLKSTIAPWLAPAQDMQEQIRATVEATRLVQPRLWVNYYTAPQHLSRMGWHTAGEDLREIGKTLARNEFLTRPSVLGVVVTFFILGSYILFFRLLERTCTEPLPPDASLGRVLGTVVHAQSPARKTALAVSSVCAVNLTLDSLTWVHVHIPFLVAQVCLLLVSVAVWARDHRHDPPLSLLLAPVLGGYLLLEGDAAPLWMVGGMVLLLGCSALVLSLRRSRSVFAQTWLAVLAVALLLTVLGFARMAALGLGCVLLCRAAFVVLWTLYHARGLQDSPLRLSLLMPFMVGWLYSLGLVLGMAYTGVDFMWEYEQAKAMQIFGLQLSLRDIFVLLALGLILLCFARVSRQMLHTASRQRSLLDFSAVPVIHAVVNSLLWVLFVLFALGLLGVDMRSLAFIGGALTVGLGLGLQNIISNFFSGLVIIFARVVRGGDIIEIGSVRGRVHSVNMRATVVETLDGAVLLVPNVEMLNSRLTNWTRNNRHVRDDVVLRLTQNNDVDMAMALMERVALGHPGILPSPAPKALLLKGDEGVVDIALQVWVADVDSKRSILSALRTELYHAFVREGVSLAALEMDVVVKQAPAA